MVRDSEQQNELWTPTSYWRGYCNRITRELAARGLSGFRTNQAILKGFAGGGVSQATMPVAGWKRAIWKATERLPVVKRIVVEHRRLVHAEHIRCVQCQVRLAALMLDRVAVDFPNLSPPEGLASGGAEDVFLWRGHAVTSDWLVHVVRAAAFYRVFSPETIGSILEIGPGLGLSTLAHLALNPHLSIVVNVDIPPVLYVSTQFLKSVKGIRVVDYRNCQKLEQIRPVAFDEPVVWQIAPWQLPRVEGRYDAFFNAYSFQEMEKDVCANYIRVVKALVAKHVVLHSSVAGHKSGAGGQKEPIPIDFLCDLFRDQFPKQRGLTNPELEVFERPENAVVLSKAAK